MKKPNEPSQRDWDRQEKRVAADGRLSAWVVSGDYAAVRADGVVAQFSHGGSFPFTVLRPLKKPKKDGTRTIFNEHLPGKAKSARAFKTLAGAMKAADEAWPL